MGRQAFLTRLAFGRSAFEPLEQPPSIGDDIDEAAQHDLDEDPTHQVATSAQQAPGADEYVQQYDERGHPCNPEAQTRASQSRQAQNDVLAAVGVVKRRDDQARKDRSFATRIAADRLKLEDTIGASIEVAALGLLICCTWWLESIRLRFLVFSYPLNVPTFNILHSERRILGNFAFFVAGLPARAFYYLLLEGLDTCTEMLLVPLDRLLIATVQSLAQRNRYKTYIAKFGVISRWAAKILLSPILVYSNLQRLHLIPASPKLPYWRSLIPFSRSSPFQLLPNPTKFAGKDLRSWMWSLLLFPTTIYLVLLAFNYIDEFSFTELPRPAIVKPTNKDSVVKDLAISRIAMAKPSGVSERLKMQFLAGVCRVRYRFLQALGWTKSPPRRLRRLRKTHQPSSSVPPTDTDDNGDGTHTPSSEAISAYTDALETHTQHDPDTTISSGDFADAGTLEVHEGNGRIQRISDLSLAPAEILSSQVDATLMEWAFAPLEAITMRCLALAFLSATARLTTQQQASAGSIKKTVHSTLLGPVVGGVLGLLGATRGIDLENNDGRMNRLWRIGVYLGRIGLTWTAQTAVGLSLWGLEWAIVRTVGKRVFGWGTL